MEPFGSINQRPYVCVCVCVSPSLSLYLLKGFIFEGFVGLVLQNNHCLDWKMGSYQRVLVYILYVEPLTSVLRFGV